MRAQALPIWQANFDTPLGPLEALATEYGLLSLSFVEKPSATGSRSKPKNGRMKPGPKSSYQTVVPNKSSRSRVIQDTALWLKHYFRKDFNKLRLPDLDLQGSLFATSAWRALLKVGVGKTQSYGELARKIKRPDAQRAIGRVMGQNPIVLIVPCHRIIGANGSLTGYGGGLERKLWLLSHEQD
jgi:O-6-methylguanine DNA methyltransferase